MDRIYGMIIGAMKCGTSSLFDILSRHPQICPARPKETEFFSRNQGHGPRFTARNYDAFFRVDPKVHKCYLEASTGYTKYPMEQGLPERIRDYGLSPRFIYIIRDPIKRIESQINYLAVNLKQARQSRIQHLIDLSSYNLQLEQYLRVFDRESLCILDFDALRASPQSTVSRTVDHLGLPRADFDMSLPHVNKTERTLSDLIAQSRFSRLYERLHPGLKWRSEMYLLSKWRVGSILRLTPEDETYFREALAEDMRRFRENFGVDVAKWGF